MEFSATRKDGSCVKKGVHLFVGARPRSFSACSKSAIQVEIKWTKLELLALLYDLFLSCQVLHCAALFLNRTFTVLWVD